MLSMFTQVLGTCRTETTFLRSWTMLTFVLVSSVVLGRSVNGQSCDFDLGCDWTIKQGFRIVNSSDLAQSDPERYDSPSFHNNDGHFVVLDGGTSQKGRLRGPWGTVVTGHRTLCLSLEIYSGWGNDPGGQLVIQVISGTNRKEVNITDLSELASHQWQEVTSGPFRVYEKFRVNIDVYLDQTDSFLAIDNVSLIECKTDEPEGEYSCSETEFDCGQSECVPVSRVCNLNKDCTNNRDEDPELCGVLPEWSQCTFEKDMCGWHNIDAKNEYGNWTRFCGASPTLYTGPHTDHTTKTDKGYYVYIEGNGLESVTDVILESPVYPAIPSQYTDLDSPTSGQCKVRFFYHMLGVDIGGLTLELKEPCSPDDDQTTSPWQQMAEQGKEWLFAEVPLTTKNRFILRFSGFRGFLYHGDIAIDDISFSPECLGYTVNETHLVKTDNVEDIDLVDTYCMKESEVNTSDTVTYEPSSQNFSEHTGRDDPNRTLGIEYIIIIVAASVVLTVSMITVLLCFAIRKKNERQMQSAHLEMMSNDSDEVCVNAPAQSSIFDMRCAVTELNPNYDFITAKFPEQQLREIPRNKLTMLKQLGQGAFGEVYEGRLRNMCANVTELPVAVKTLPALSTEQAEMDFLMEAVIIGKFMHKNVVKCLGVCFDEHPRYIVLELLKGGDLRTFLRDSRPKRDQPCSLMMEDLVKLALDVAHGCRHLEEKHFVHRDIAARNCLLTSREADRTAKIADFGMSRDIYSADYYRKGGKAMLPIKWMPPEAFLDGVFTTKTDVWSFGVLLWEIFTLGYMPYPGQTNTDVMNSVAAGGRLDPPHNCPARLNKIMLMCWNSIPEIRPSFNEIIEHLDMCLQDPEVIGTDPGMCHVPVRETFKDASILVKPNNAADTPPTSLSPDALPAEESSAQFSRHMESQSREPLLPPAEPEEV